MGIKKCSIFVDKQYKFCGQRKESGVKKSKNPVDVIYGSSHCRRLIRPRVRVWPHPVQVWVPPRRRRRHRSMHLGRPSVAPSRRHRDGYRVGNRIAVSRTRAQQPRPRRGEDESSAGTNTKKRDPGVPTLFRTPESDL